MKIKKKQSPLERKMLKLLERRQQDIDRGIAHYGEPLFPRITEQIDINNPLYTKVSIEPYNPFTTSSAEIEVANAFLEDHKRWLIGKKSIQKRVRPNHKRDKKLADDKQKKVIVPTTGTSKLKEVTISTVLDDLVYKETEKIVDDQKFSEADRKVRKKLTEAKHRYHKST